MDSGETKIVKDWEGRSDRPL